MKLIADPIELPNNSSWQAIEDAKLNAKWHVVQSRESIMLQTDLEGKCGSCKHFCPIKGAYIKSCGNCTNPENNVRVKKNRSRTSTCKAYERKKGWEKRYL